MAQGLPRASAARAEPDGVGSVGGASPVLASGNEMNCTLIDLVSEWKGWVPAAP